MTSRNSRNLFAGLGACILLAVCFYLPRLTIDGTPEKTMATFLGFKDSIYGHVFRTILSTLMTCIGTVFLPGFCWLRVLRNSPVGRAAAVDRDTSDPLMPAALLGLFMFCVVGFLEKVFHFGRPGYIMIMAIFCFPLIFPGTRKDLFKVLRGSAPQLAVCAFSWTLFLLVARFSFFLSSPFEDEIYRAQNVVAWDKWPPFDNYLFAKGTQFRPYFFVEFFASRLALISGQRSIEIYFLAFPALIWLAIFFALQNLVRNASSRPARPLVLIAAPLLLLLLSSTGFDGNTHMLVRQSMFALLFVILCSTHLSRFVSSTSRLDLILGAISLFFMFMAKSAPAMIMAPLYLLALSVRRQRSLKDRFLDLLLVILPVYFVYSLIRFGLGSISVSPALMPYWNFWNYKLYNFDVWFAPFSQFVSTTFSGRLEAVMTGVLYYFLSAGGVFLLVAYHYGPLLRRRSWSGDLILFHSSVFALVVFSGGCFLSFFLFHIPADTGVAESYYQMFFTFGGAVCGTLALCRLLEKRPSILGIAFASLVVIAMVFGFMNVKHLLVEQGKGYMGNYCDNDLISILGEMDSKTTEDVLVFHEMGDSRASFCVTAVGGRRQFMSYRLYGGVLAEPDAKPRRADQDRVIAEVCATGAFDHWMPENVAPVFLCSLKAYADGNPRPVIARNAKYVLLR